MESRGGRKHLTGLSSTSAPRVGRRAEAQADGSWPVPGLAVVTLVPPSCSEGGPQTAFAGGPDGEPPQVWASRLKGTRLQKSVKLLSRKQFGKGLNLYYFSQVPALMRERCKMRGTPGRMASAAEVGCGHVAMATHQLPISLRRTATRGGRRRRALGVRERASTEEPQARSRPVLLPLARGDGANENPNTERE